MVAVRKAVPMPFAPFAGVVFAKCHSTEAEFMRIALRALIAAAEKGSGDKVREVKPSCEVNTASEK